MEVLLRTEVVQRGHTHFIVEEIETQRKEVTCSSPQSQRKTELVLLGWPPRPRFPQPLTL